MRLQHGDEKYCPNQVLFQIAQTQKKKSCCEHLYTKDYLITWILSCIQKSMQTNTENKLGVAPLAKTHTDFHGQILSPLLAPRTGT